jgi:hypothetical protein
VLAAAFFLLPVLDRSRAGSRAARLPIAGIGVVLVLLWLYAGFRGGPS